MHGMISLVCLLLVRWVQLMYCGSSRWYEVHVRSVYDLNGVLHVNLQLMHCFLPGFTKVLLTQPESGAAVFSDIHLCELVCECGVCYRWRSLHVAYCTNIMVALRLCVILVILVCDTYVPYGCVTPAACGQACRMLHGMMNIPEPIARLCECGFCLLAASVCCASRCSACPCYVLMHACQNSNVQLSGFVCRATEHHKLVKLMCMHMVRTVAFRDRAGSCSFTHGFACCLRQQQFARCLHCCCRLLSSLLCASHGGVKP
jgi:hypothetical protein